jgi:hypothetical protein
MRRLITTVFMFALVMAPAAVFAGQVWTDGNGDGLPDVANQNRQPSDLVTVDVWIDSQSFQWTYYQAWIERDPCFVSATGVYVVTGGSNFPLDMDVSRPMTAGFAGSGFNRHGAVLVGRLTAHYAGSPAKCCFRPVINIEDPYGVFSIVGAGTAYLTFATASGTCVQRPPQSTEATTWGAIKGIYQ